ncbi:response regulator [Brevundimonas sp. S30B]|uniref:ATP-binding protein n=1 Tax=unclassified Brevundimonas TaxID=2622653 RepID=UPI001071F0CD|nr:MULTISPECIES: ATP-binding protein [unclassified Brevundimonas]QBX37597.1 response regulator [Brevundimonas sp. MF30-B]TFW03610.1 response regulator [Brevundimonas sp. S30B]
MQQSTYAIVAEVRFRELKTRIGLAAFIGLVAWVLSPSIFPLVWFGAVVVSQMIDWLVFRPFRLKPERPVTLSRKIVCCVTASLSVVVYSSIAAYLWFTAGEVGRLFAIVQVAGGLLHVSLHMHEVRPLLLSAAIPHGLYFLGLPILSAWITGQRHVALIALGGVLYLMHLVVAVRQSSSTNNALRRANEVADQERRKAEVASAAKSDFLAVISHEIRTPMNAVISSANLLRRTRLDKDQQEHVAMLTEAGDVLMGLLNDVLDFSKIEAGRMSLESAEMDLRDRLSMLERMWQPRAEANGVELTVRVAPDAPDCILTDPLRLQQILFNLISNAVKFTDQGRIDVTAEWDAGEGRLNVTVRDTGCGIPAERLARVFDSFEQADAGTTRRYGGTGLGLAISRRLAELMGGSLTAASREGEGSAFVLSLPAQVVDASSSRPVKPEADGQALFGRSVLVVDDHEVNRRIVGLLLQPHGLRLTFAVNGEEAVEIARNAEFDVVLMDMQMPVMDGLEATRAIRSEGPNIDTPIIALTANAMDNHRAAWDAVGVRAFLTKPIEPTLLVTALAEACASPRDDQAQRAKA